MAAIYLGGCVRALSERRARQHEKQERDQQKKDSADPGILAASGLVAGEGLAGVVLAGLVAAQLVPRTMDPRLPGLVGDIGVLVILLLVSAFLYRAANSTRRQQIAK
jgi:hypothetical protein